MTELETMKRAKLYLDKLANGIDPLTDRPVSDCDCINQVRISRCLFYVSDVLRKVIENGGEVVKTGKVKKEPFTISHEDLMGFPLSGSPISVTEITKRINELVDTSAMTRLKHGSITAFLMQSGLLQEEQAEDGKTVKIPTAQGQLIGISVEKRHGQFGPYRVTLYNTDAQQLILDNMDSIIEINSQKPALSANRAEFQGKPWTDDNDEKLTALFRKNIPVYEIAAAMGRSPDGIRARLKRLGLIENRSDAN